MRIASSLMIALLGLTVLAPAASAQQLVDPRPREDRLIDARGVSLDQAVQMAQRRYGARAVKAETVSQGDRRVHRIRLMSHEGKVWHVHVDAQTGDMN
jgi:uncharacterized membrane protein YkoI